MRLLAITKDRGNLFFDQAEPRCSCEVVSGGRGEDFAFVQCLDLGEWGDVPPAVAPARCYWGCFSHDDIEGSILGIMENGDIWPLLPWRKTK